MKMQTEKHKLAQRIMEDYDGLHRIAADCQGFPERGREAGGRAKREAGKGALGGLNYVFYLLICLLMY